MKILERLLLWLRSIEKANFAFFISFCLASCHVWHPLCVTDCVCPFPATLLIPAPLCSWMSSHAKHRKGNSLEISLRDRNQRAPSALAAWCLCVQHLGIHDSWGKSPAHWSNVAESSNAMLLQPRSSTLERIALHLPVEPWFGYHLCLHTVPSWGGIWTKIYKNFAV